MLIPDRLFETIADPEFFESFKRYRPTEADFMDPLRQSLPTDWTLTREGVWAYCMPRQSALPAEGWKIHLSATLTNARPLLATVARCLTGRCVAFKFIADRLLLGLVNGKRWDRGGAGKFITIYPRDQRECGQLLESLYPMTLGYRGPYILSDRRYRDSVVLHYRYGGIAPTRALEVDGALVPVMRAPDGSTIRDDRLPYFQLPAGVTDPFVGGEEPAEGDDTPSLKGGRYTIERALTFSNSGGVFVGTDQTTGQQVLIKEARPFTNQAIRGTDAVWQLQKEHRLLTLLERECIAPKPIDFFRDWEHFYLVEEYLEGRVLRGFNSQHALAMRTAPTLADAKQFVERFCRIFSRIAQIFALLHSYGVIFSDVSPYNVFVLVGDDSPRLIDFEGAYEEGLDEPTLIYTPGFASAELLAKGASTREDDCFGLGGLMLAALMPINRILTLNPRAHEGFLRSFVRDLGFPVPIARVIGDMLEPDRAKRPDLATVIDVLGQEHAVQTPAIGAAEASSEDAESLVRRAIDFILASASYEREDRLFPAAPEVFTTNPLGIAFGATGVAHALKRITGIVPDRVVDWMLQRKITADMYPAGLYVGLAGIAWVFSEIGLRERALEVLRLADNHPLRDKSPDLFYGTAGWGMAHLRFFVDTGDQYHLDRAEEAGRLLLTTGTRRDGMRWYSSMGHDCSGFAHGAAGISLFFLYMYKATDEERYLNAARECLEYTTSRALETINGGWSWRAREDEPTHTPYWRWGSAGIGMAMLRYHAVCGDPVTRSWIEKILPDTDRKYTIFPGRLFGLAGIGDFYLDLAEFGVASAVALESAKKILSGILLFRLDRPAGLAFPGETLARISCDFGTGSAGVAMFMHRLSTGGPPSFMVDELLGESWRSSQPWDSRFELSLSHLSNSGGSTAV
ncbi:MAG: protein kinase/lanthionine synthetase C family protein [Gemmatimonadaceae bacterium]|nr:protein kinase/lanthionine synthetase C family protein [Gemmatimonadaceae bacterium]